MLQFKYKNKIHTITDDQLKIISGRATAIIWLLLKETMRRKSLYLGLLLTKGLVLFCTTRLIKLLQFNVPAKLDALALATDICVKEYVMGVSFKIKIDCVIIDGKEFQFKTAPFGLITSIIGSDQYLLQTGLFKNKAVVDIGANVGIFSILAAAVGAKKVFAYEPVPQTVGLFTENVAINKLQPRITIFEKGVSDKKGSMNIFFNGAGDEGASLLFAKHKFSKKVPITTLDDDALGPISLIKIDAEGFEAEILRGAQKVIAKYKPVIVMAAYHKKDDVKTLSDVVSGIDSGYKFIVKQDPEVDLVCYPTSNKSQMKVIERTLKNR